MPIATRLGTIRQPSTAVLSPSGTNRRQITAAETCAAASRRLFHVIDMSARQASRWEANNAVDALTHQLDDAGQAGTRATLIRLGERGDHRRLDPSSRNGTASTVAGWTYRARSNFHRPAFWSFAPVNQMLAACRDRLDAGGRRQTRERLPKRSAGTAREDRRTCRWLRTFL